MSKTEYNRIYHKARYHRRCEIAKERLGGCCAICDSQNDLQFDHIDPSTKEYTVTQKWFLPLEQWFLEIDKCQLLCEKHHLEKTSRESQTRTHGTISMYRWEKCRCDLCVKANSIYSAKYSKNRIWCKLCKKRYYKSCKVHAPVD